MSSNFTISSSKCGISPVVATALLLVVSVVSIVGFQTWYNSYQSSLFSQLQEDGSSDTIVTGIDTVIDSTLYFNNGNINLSINDIQIDGTSCGISPSNYSFGLNAINIGSCMNNALSATPTIFILSTKGVFVKNLYYKNFGTNFLDCSLLNGGEWSLVPGNDVLNVSSFCVMKYEAKSTSLSEANLFDGANMYCGNGNDYGSNNCSTNGSVIITSKAASIPLTQVSTIESRLLCSNLGEGYNLITDPQWVTLARNIENVAVNWADNTIGSTISMGGGLKRGNNGLDDNASYNAASDPADRSLDTNSKAMHTLSNGDEVWDISGNVREWTNDTFDSNAESALGMGSNNWYSWLNITGYNYLRASNLSFTSSQGIGRVFASTGNAFPSGTIHSSMRGGVWHDEVNVGVFTLHTLNGPEVSHLTVGFRCAYSPDFT